MLFSNNIYFWVIILIIAVIIEAVSLNMTAIWFAVGAIAALFVRMANGSFTTQLIVFVVISAVSMILLRPFTQKILKVNRETTNADRIIGQTAVVTVPIDNLKSTGQIRIFGQVWSAKSEKGEYIEEGESVKIISITGVKASVEKINNN